MKTRCDNCNSLIITGDCKNGKYHCSFCKNKGYLYLKNKNQRDGIKNEI